MKQLLLGPAPDDFSADRHMPLGPFCFLGREERFPGFEDLPYLPEPLQDPDRLELESRKAAAFANRLLPRVAERLNRANNAAHDLEFWRLLLMPWLMPFAQVLRERQAGIRQAVASLGQTPMRVELAEDVPGWNFADIDDWYARGVMAMPFNEWLHSRILERNAPACWHVATRPVEAVRQAAALRPPVDFGVRPLAWRNAWPKFKKLFYAHSRCRGRIPGVTAWDRLLFTCVLALKKPRPAASLPPPPPLAAADDWDFDAEAVVMRCIPRCFKDLGTIPAQTPRVRAGKLRLTGNVLFSVEPEKLFLARCVEAGERLVSTQHGGLNAVMRENAYEQEILFRRHVLFTWGWERYDDYAVQAVPLPSPMLSAVSDRHERANDRLLVVGEYAPLFANRLKSMPTPRQNLAYRKNLDAFFAALPATLRDTVFYRPYLNESAALQNRAHLRQRFPWLQEMTSSIDAFHEEMLRCRLFVHSYPGTTLNLAMAANVPSLCFWHRDAWRMTRQAHELMEALRAAGIVHEDGERCAQAVADILGRADAWWNSSEIQSLRAAYCRTYALASGNWRREWLARLWSL